MFFARLVVPRVLVSDNGPQFISDEFKEFCQRNGVQHIKSTPYHPKTNGLAERAVRTFKERMLAGKKTDDVNTRLQKFLFSYRNTPQKSTGRPPAELLMGRRLRTCLDLLKPDVRGKLDASNFKSQRQHDEKSQSRTFMENDPVWVQNPNGSGSTSGKIFRRTGPLSYEVMIEGKRHRKHADQLRFRRVNFQLPPSADDVTDTGTEVETDHESEYEDALPNLPPTLPMFYPTSRAPEVVPRAVPEPEMAVAPPTPSCSSSTAPSASTKTAFSNRPPAAKQTVTNPVKPVLKHSKVATPSVSPTVPLPQTEQTLRRSQRTRRFPDQCSIRRSDHTLTVLISRTLKPVIHRRVT